MRLARLSVNSRVNAIMIAMIWRVYGRPASVFENVRCITTRARSRYRRPLLKQHPKKQSSSSGRSKYQELALQQDNKPIGFDPKKMKIGPPKRSWMEYIVAGGIGIVSGTYLFAEPLRHHFAEQAADRNKAGSGESLECT